MIGATFDVSLPFADADGGGSNDWRAVLEWRLRRHAYFYVQAFRAGDTSYLLAAHDDQLESALAMRGIRTFAERHGQPLTDLSHGELRSAADPAGCLVVPGGTFDATRRPLDLRELVGAAARFRRVVLLPSAFGPPTGDVRAFLATPGVVGVARDPHSYAVAKAHGKLALGLDPAVVGAAAEVDRPPVNQPTGTLRALRTDAWGALRAAGLRPAAGNLDPAERPELDVWVERVHRAAHVVTDSLAVALLAAFAATPVDVIDSPDPAVGEQLTYTFRVPSPLMTRRPVSWALADGHATDEEAS